MSNLEKKRLNVFPLYLRACSTVRCLSEQNIYEENQFSNGGQNKSETMASVRSDSVDIDARLPHSLLGREIEAKLK